MSKFLARSLALMLFITLAQYASAQDQTSPSSSSQQLLSSAQLDQLVAPIALYPDNLLSEVIMASTYPLEVVQADRWLKDNKNLQGEQLVSAADKQGWDDSVKSLTATPDVLSMMSTKLDWTQKLGDAVLAQQSDVMDAVQRLRGKAQANNKLSSTKEQKVSVSTVDTRQVIAIEPTQPDTVYVPYYDPGVVYGDWSYPDYPPDYFGYPGYIPGAAIATGIAFGAGIAVGAWAANHGYWGGGVNWGNRNINVNRNNVVNNWTHNPDHRHGVRYGNANVQQKFANRGNHGNAQNRADFRGHTGQQGAGNRNRPNAGDRGAANRQNAGDRNKRNAANRKGSNQKAANRQASNRQNAGTRNSAQRNAAAQRGSGQDRAFSNVGNGRTAMAQSARGHASMGARSASFARAGGGGGFHGGGGGHGGGRRSDIRLKHGITLIDRLDNGIGFYRFSYNGDDTAYVGVMAQEVQEVMPYAVARGRDGYLRVFYNKLGITFQTYDRWLAAGARIPSVHDTPKDSHPEN